tara:strand:- start:63 stop:629 length:567 start_codon:yes stop_codon:yes gene_type:complete
MSFVGLYITFGGGNECFTLHHETDIPMFGRRTGSNLFNGGITDITMLGRRTGSNLFNDREKEQLRLFARLFLNCDETSTSPDATQKHVYLFQLLAFLKVYPGLRRQMGRIFMSYVKTTVYSFRCSIKGCHQNIPKSPSYVVCRKHTHVCDECGEMHEEDKRNVSGLYNECCENCPVCEECECVSPCDC